MHHHVFDNGLTLLAEPRSDAASAAIGFFVSAGARDEDSAVMGVSHFLEHMMFKGTARRSADDVNREFDEIGANYNAFTSEEMTVYFAQVLPEMLGQAVDLFTDMLRPALRSEDFDMEKKVILEEIGMYEDRPMWRAFDHLLESHFAGHPLGHRVLGTTDTVGALSPDQMRSYFESRYSPGNIVVAAAGQLDFDKLRDEIDKRTRHWKPAAVRRDYSQPAIVGGELNMTDERLSRHYAAMLCPAPPVQDPRRYAARVLSDVIGDAEGSRLYWALVDPGLADEADFAHMGQDRIGSFMGSLSCDPENADRVEEIYFNTLAGLKDALSADEVERAKNKLATQVVRRGESPQGRMVDLGGTWLYLQKQIPLEEELDNVTRVSLDDVRDLLDEYSFTPRTIVRLGPNK